MEKSNYLIYIIENDKPLLELLKRRLNKEGYKNIAISYGNDFNKDIINENTLLVLDYKLGAKTAEDIIINLKEKNINTPFLIITGLDDINIAVKMMKLGAKDYLIKDKDFLELLPAIINKTINEIEIEKKYKIASDKLRNSEITSRVLINAFNDSVLLMETDGTILDINEAGANNLINNIDNLIGKCIYNFYPEKIAKNREKKAQEAIKNKTAIHYEEYIDDRIYENIIYPVVDDSGKVNKLASLSRDITEKKYLEEEKRSQELLKQRLDKLVSLSNLTSAINHEIKQPLNSIKVLADSILYMYKIEKNVPYEDVIDDISTISKRVDRINDIIKSMRLLIKAPDKIEIKRIDINKQVKNASGFYKNKLNNHNISLTLDFAKEEIIAIGSEIQFQQVIINLIDNSINAFDIESNDEKSIIIKTYEESESVVAEVIDNGPGIKNEDKEKIFEPFYTLKDNSESMGMGLFIIKNILKCFNAKIIVMDNDKGGAVFKIVLQKEVYPYEDTYS